MTAAEITQELGVGTTAVYKRLKKKMGKWKPTYRPGIVFYIFIKISVTYLSTKEELVSCCHHDDQHDNHHDGHRERGGTSDWSGVECGGFISNENTKTTDRAILSN